MAIKIKLKSKSASSNEDKTLPEKAASTSSPGKAPVSTVSCTLSPFIDKISIVLDFPEGESAHDTHVATFQYINDKELFVEGTKWGKFKIGKRIVIPHLVDKKKWPLFQYSYFGQMANAIRLEFSPVDLGPDGMNELHATLMLMMDSGWHTVAKHGRATMMEVSVNALDVETDVFHVVPHQSATVRTWDRAGRLETLVIGKSSGNQTKVYDRKEKRKAKGQTGPLYEGTRIERRLRFGKPVPVRDLGKIPNPFLAFQLVVRPKSKPEGEPKDYVWAMFWDSVQIRGLPNALALLPAEKRTLYRGWLKQHPADWWDSNAIWSKWSSYLATTQIAEPDKWH